MRDPGTSARLLLRGLVKAAEAVGVNRSELCAGLGMEPSELDSDDPIPTPMFVRAWQLAAELSKDPHFGLHAGQHAELGSYDVVDYLFVTSATLGDACRMMSSYYRIVTDIARVDLVIDEQIGRFRHWVPPDYVMPLRHAWDFFFAAALKRIHAVAQEPVELLAIHLMQPEPADAREYRKVFGYPVQFGHPVSEFVFDPRYLEVTVVSSNPSLHRLVQRHARELLARLPVEGDLLTRASAMVGELLADPKLSLQLLSRRLGVSDRTLQRKLADHGMSYTLLVERAREELAVRQLEVGALSISELAFRLGFNSVRAFTRAFKRWRGVAPREFQQQARARLSGDRLRRAD
jgi:AraC-like DNA-binding protein